MKIKLNPLDVLFSRYIRLRADNHCEYCGAYKEQLQCSHFHGRRKQSVRYDPDNAAALCFTCHLFVGENPYVHTEWFKKRLGSERFDKLNIRANIPTRIDKEALTIWLKDKIKELENEDTRS